MNSAHQRQHADAACCGSGCATVPVAPEPTASDATTIEPQRFRIANMDCASEESEIRRALEGMAGIRSLRFNLGKRELAIAADDHALQQALDAITCGASCDTKRHRPGFWRRFDCPGHPAALSRRHGRSAPDVAGRTIAGAGRSGKT